jgi:hypothetical protein
MKNNNNEFFTVVLDRTTHQWAAKFAAQQSTPAKGKQVYLNTLAVCAVRQYLSSVGQLEIDLSLSAAWQPGVPSLLDVADLVIPHVGSIECRPVLPGATWMHLPAETIDQRLGYVAVQFNEELNSVDIIGFMPSPVTLNTQSIDYSIDQLHPLDQLLDIIFQQRTTNLAQLLAGILGIDWEPITCSNGPTTHPTIGKLVSSGQPTGLASREFALRNVVSTLNNNPYDSIHNFTAGKLINLQAQIANIPLLLLIGLSRETDGRILVRTRIYAAGQEPLLPAHLKLTLQEKQGQSLSQVQYPEAMTFIQLQPFRLTAGTHFNIQVTLNESSFTESFVA